MSEPRPGQRFRVDPESPPYFTAAPEPGERFSPDSASHPLATQDTAPDVPLEASLGKPRKRRWGLVTLLGGALALGGLEVARQLYTATLGGDWLAGAWSALGLFGLGLGAAALLRELWRLRRLKRHTQLRDQLDAPEETTPQDMQALAERLRRQMQLGDDDPHWRAFQAAHQPHHDAKETRTLLAHHLLAPRDRQARRLIARMSSETAVMVAVSPVTFFDMALMAWRNIALIDRLAALYGLELGYASRLRLFRAVLYNMAFAGASEIATDAGMDLLSMNVAGKLSTRAGQGLGAGLLTARLGLRTLRMTRPIPFNEGEAPRLADLRRELWQRLRRLETQSDNQQSTSS
ncbi:TIGR01620 family protein [Chromohalobacter canadensis]|uniref:YcjF family protein n=1 Tax=Chromohalobacter canadensis TaxID=141389 RepID=UPI0021C188F5|nr:YcjF family protein [Chromohalobacter canadensis]MCT8467689.1 TIGR01620 family protein [Chromohalobacter canadensis]MCT8470563.1 TIGR01620 family protein [Chromohalobacter canadensis]MCT8498186.1 TIGR01620 family protein [Chromohalobacter canadensis]